MVQLLHYLQVLIGQLLSNDSAFVVYKCFSFIPIKLSTSIDYFGIYDELFLLGVFKLKR